MQAFCNTYSDFQMEMMLLQKKNWEDNSFRYLSFSTNIFCLLNTSKSVFLDYNRGEVELSNYIWCQKLKKIHFWINWQLKVKVITTSTVFDNYHKIAIPDHGICIPKFWHTWRTWVNTKKHISGVIPFTNAFT